MFLKKKILNVFEIVNIKLKKMVFMFCYCFKRRIVYCVIQDKVVLVQGILKIQNVLEDSMYVVSGIDVMLFRSGVCL